MPLPPWNVPHNVIIPQDNPRNPVAFDHSGAEFQTNYVNDAGGAPEGMLGFGGIALHIARIWNPKIRSFKGLKNSGGLNNNDNYYLPRIARYMPRRSASPRAVQNVRSMAAVQYNVPIQSVRVPVQELR